MNTRPVGKKAEPTIEELEFIYSQLARLSDQEVLEELEDTEFPPRSLGFLKRRRREFNAAKKVLQVQLAKEIDPLAAKRRQEHFTKLAGISTSLLANDLHRVIEGGTYTRANASGEPTEPRQVEYTLVSGSDGAPYKLTHEQLSNQLMANIELTVHGYTNLFFCSCFLPHLMSELSVDARTTDFWVMAREQPYQLIETLRLLAERKTFKGTCPVCKDWSSS